jgi:hypothetical protein
MPQIPEVPTLQPVPQPSMSPAEAARPGEALARLGEQIGAASEYASRFFQILDQRNAEEAIKHQTIAAENKLDAWHDQFAQGLKNLTNYSDWPQMLEDSAKKAQDSIESELTLPHDSHGEARLKNSIEAAMLARKEGLRQIISAKTSLVLDQQNILGFNTLYNTALKEYLATPDPQAKDQIFNELAAKGQHIGAGNEKTANFVTNKLIGFKNQADAQQLFQDMGRNPVQTMKDLSDAKNYPNLLPEQRAQLGESATRAAYYEEAQSLARQERTQKEFELGQNSEIDRLVISHGHGKNVSADLVADMDHGVLDSEGVLKVTERIKKIDEATNYETRQENPAAKADVIRRTYGASPDMTEGELGTRFKAGEINGSTYKEALTHLSETRHRLEDKGKESQNKEYENAQRRLGLLFAPKGPFEKYAEGVQSLEAEALQQLYKMAYKEGIPPGEAVDKINKQYGPAINASAFSATRRARKALAIPGSDKLSVPDLGRWLLDHKNSISASAYDADCDLLRQIKAGEEQSKPAEKTSPEGAKDEYAP